MCPNTGTVCNVKLSERGIKLSHATLELYEVYEVYGVSVCVLRITGEAGGESCIQQA